MKMGLARPFSPFSGDNYGEANLPIPASDKEGLAEPQVTLIFRSLKMIRSVNGCSEPINFMRLSNHFQTWEDVPQKGCELQGCLSPGEDGGAS